MSTQNVNSASTHPLYKAPADSKAAKTSAADDMQSRFLNLLITQLKNQDPMNPTDANQMTAQLSQISTVSGIEKLNATMEQLLGSYNTVQNMQAAAMIGKTVFVAGNGLSLGSQGAMGGFELSAPADKVVVNIKDASGKLVTAQEIGGMPAGISNFYWDGKLEDGSAAPEGNYSFSFEASMGDKPVTGTSLQAGTISALTMLSNGVSLQLSNNQSISYADIRQILN
jgi:flagellar basal-body rod modification protein FlgD